MKEILGDGIIQLSQLYTAVASWWWRRRMAAYASSLIELGSTLPNLHETLHELGTTKIITMSNLRSYSQHQIATVTRSPDEQHLGWFTWFHGTGEARRSDTSNLEDSSPINWRSPSKNANFDTLSRPTETYPRSSTNRKQLRASTKQSWILNNFCDMKKTINLGIPGSLNSYWDTGLLAMEAKLRGLRITSPPMDMDNINDKKMAEQFADHLFSGDFTSFWS